VCIGLLLAIALGEAIVRLQFPRSQPVKTYTIGVGSVPDPLGFRDKGRLAGLPTESEVVRIAFLGDSYTFGLGVEWSETFVHRVGVLLRKRWPAPCITVNLGRPAADLLTAWLLYDRNRDSVLADVLVQVVSPNDLDVDNYSDLRAIHRLSDQRLWPSRYSRLFEYAESSIRGRLSFDRYVDYLRGGATVEQQERAWRIASFQIESVRALAHEDGTRYVLVQFPWLYQLDPYPLAEQHQRMGDLAARLDVPYLDLREVFRGRHPGNLCVSPRDGHPSTEAHRIAAAAICDLLIDRVLPRVHPRAASGQTALRTPEQVNAAAVEHCRRTLQIDRTCLAARFWLNTQLSRTPRPE